MVVSVNSQAKKKKAKKRMRPLRRTNSLRRSFSRCNPSTSASAASAARCLVLRNIASDQRVCIEGGKN